MSTSQSANSSCSVEDSVEVLFLLLDQLLIDTLQVLSVIRYNKLKMSAPPSTLHSISGSETGSIMSQVTFEDINIITDTTFLQGYDSRLGNFQLSKSEARLDQARVAANHQEKLRSQ